MQPNKTLPPSTRPLTVLLKPIGEAGKKKCLVLDLDETLVHSSFKVLLISISFNLGIIFYEFYYFYLFMLAYIH